MQIERATVEHLGGVDAIAAAVAEHLAALDAHRFTIGVPAPIAAPIVEDIIRGGGMAAVEIVDTPAAPPPSRAVTALEFRRRFTDAERAAITLAASRGLEQGDPTLQIWLDDLAAAGTVNLDAAEVSTALDMLVTTGLLAAERLAEVLA